MISVSGVGPNTARMILSSLNPAELEQAIAAEQSNQESILDRLVETETELDEMQEKTV